MKFRIIITTLFLGVLLAVGCTPSGLESGPAASTVVPDGATEIPPTVEEGELESMDGPELAGGEVPQNLFDSVLTDLLSLTGVERSAVSVVSAQAITWNDGSLGCPQPGVMYTMALVEGFQVVFDVDGETYDYHLSDRGQFVLCQNGLSGSSLEETE